MSSANAGWKEPTARLPKFTIPMQLGPMSRMPASRASPAIASWAPLSPTSANPEVKTTSDPTPFSAHSPSTLITAPGGTVQIARSTSPGMSLTLANAGRPWMISERGLTG